ncbi:MAG TPA: type IX secretion system membrane protein PorP/SprF [Bacteroidales bacterium]|nr:type IX secretion system membrane protein PorP/SprF [Bacteroidales bacterium]
MNLFFIPNKRIVFALTLLTSLVAVKAQQDPQFSQNMFNTMAINPGYAGSNDAICATALHREQWVGFKGAPSTSLFNVNAAIKPFKINSGIAIGVMRDNKGYDNDINLNLGYAYRLNVGDGKMLGIGVGVEMLNKSLEAEWHVPESGNFTSPDTDPLIPNKSESEMVYDFSAGVFYRTEKLYIGASSMHLRQAELGYQKGTATLARHYYLTSGYTITLTNPAFELLPSVFLKSDGKTTQLDVNTSVLYNKKFWGGLSYRLNDAIVGMVGIELSSGIKFGYAYDFTISDIGKNSGGSHEFMVGYCFSVKKEKQPQRYKSIRFL